MFGFNLFGDALRDVFDPRNTHNEGGSVIAYRSLLATGCSLLNS